MSDMYERMVKFDHFLDMPRRCRASVSSAFDNFLVVSTICMRKGLRYRKTSMSN